MDKTTTITCMNCKAKVPVESVFCQYCGNRITITEETSEADKLAIYKRMAAEWEELRNQPSSNTPSTYRSAASSPVAPVSAAATAVPRQQEKERKRHGGLIIAAICVIIIVGIYLLFQNMDNQADATLTPVAEPVTGSIFVSDNSASSNEFSSISVTAGAKAVYVKLKTNLNKTVLAFYVRANTTATVSVPCGMYYVYFASGEVWYGTANLFGSNTSYSKDNNLQDFNTYTWSYTLKESTNGNFKQTWIDKSEF